MEEIGGGASELRDGRREINGYRRGHARSAGVPILANHVASVDVASRPRAFAAAAARPAEVDCKAIELRHLRYFIAVAEELHFTRAAERLGIKQPPLSVQIRQLEEGMGTSLFRRLTRGVELTEAGALLLDKARHMLDQVEQTKVAVRRRGRGESGHMRVGFASATCFHPVVLRITSAFRERYPGVVLSTDQSSTRTVVEKLSSGDIDVEFVRPPIGDSEALAIEPVAEDAMLIALPESHPCAAKRAIPLEALAVENLILFSRSAGPGLYDSIIAGCQRVGFTPKLDQEVPQLASVVHMVAAGFGVSIVPQSIGQIRLPGVVYRNIEGEAPRAPISLAYRRDDRSVLVRNFVALARQAARSAVEDAARLWIRWPRQHAR